MIRTVFLCSDNPDLNALYTAYKPTEGEPITIKRADRAFSVIGHGVVCNVRPYPRWEGRYLYDIKVSELP